MSSETDQKDFLAVGPWGGHDGFHWDDGAQASVTKIIISYGVGINSVQFQYQDKHKSLFRSTKRGESEGDQTRKVKLKYPDEYLIAMHGYYAPMLPSDPPSVCVRALSFVSNMRTYGPFGVEEGTPFSCQMTGGQIVGFYGRSGMHINSIGAYVKHVCKKDEAIVHSLTKAAATGGQMFEYSVLDGAMTYKFNALLEINHKYMNVSSNNSSGDCHQRPTATSKHILASDTHDTEPEQKQEASGFGDVVAFGPWGVNDGTKFDDGNSYSGIRQIILTRGSRGIKSIRVLYDKNGKSIWGSTNGGEHGNTSYNNITFDYPNEILNGISGHYIYSNYDPIMSSLTFHTTKRKYGPYGSEIGESFSGCFNEGAIVGIHGTEMDGYLASIGIQLKCGKMVPPAHPSPTQSQS